MGTRGLTKVIYEGETLVAQYGQWDHYPSGQGVTAFEFLRGADNITNLRNNIKIKTYTPSESEMDEIVNQFANENGMMTWEMGEQFTKMYPSLSRDTGAGILELIANADEIVPLVLDKEFENDDLFCEGVYTINLDDNTFTTKYGNNETVISFDEVYNIGKEDYLIKCDCPVYQYELDNAAVSQ